ncbi:hypothetical protein V7200_17810 [Cytobacillus firmus]|uniref:DUF8042 domain-containing protein n=1 Tax=Cytobacillus firmus TaxID=1399 RepID=A0A800NDY3_CYTFI|nr:hypothetical protein [Cytobacillus firmus]KAF0825138.1 hypothetical protein KIS1582_1151 [Cytobacillus firmus]
MEKYIEVMKKSQELAETVLEGLQHIQKLIGEGKHEQSILLFEDVLLAYSTIGRSIDSVIRELGNDTVSAQQADVSKAAELVVSAFEEKNYAKVQEVLQFTLIPQFKKLTAEFEKAFQPYLVS